MIIDLLDEYNLFNNANMTGGLMVKVNSCFNVSNFLLKNYLSNEFTYRLIESVVGINSLVLKYLK